jgi:hypothetical protein
MAVCQKLKRSSWRTLTIGIEEHAVKRVGMCSDDLGCITLEKIDSHAQPSLAQVRICDRSCVCLALDTDYVTVDPACSPGQPDGCVSIRGANFKKPTASTAVQQHAEQEDGCWLQVQHVPALIVLLGIIMSSASSSLFNNWRR